MGVFNNNPAVGAVMDKKSPAYAVRQYNIARSNLMLALILTIVNILLGILGADIYMLFSISFPYFMFSITDIVWSIPAIIVLGVYFVYYLCSKKKPGFMIAALITFAFDFLFLVIFSLFLINISNGEITAADFIMDYLTHIWVLVYLIIGTRFVKRYKAAIREDRSLVSGSAFRNALIPAVINREEADFSAKGENNEFTSGDEQSTENI